MISSITTGVQQPRRWVLYYDLLSYPRPHESNLLDNDRDARGTGLGSILRTVLISETPQNNLLDNDRYAAATAMYCSMKHVVPYETTQDDLLHHDSDAGTTVIDCIIKTVILSETLPSYPYS